MSETNKTITLSQAQLEYFEQSVKLWKETRNYKLKNSLVFGIVSELDYILNGGSENGKN